MAEVDLLLKLFDTLKDAMKETQQLCHALLTNQNNITNYMQNLPMEDLRQALKEHSKESSDDIGTCTETVEEKTDTILSKVNLIDMKVGRMIVAVIVAFSLFSVAYFIGRYTTDNNKQFKEWEEKMEGKAIEDHDEIKREIVETIREEYRKNKK